MYRESLQTNKRAMAADQIRVMQALGFPRFRLAGLDRGARVAHRLCLDHPAAVERVAVLDISPTRIMYARTDQAFATAYYHWFSDPAVRPARAAGQLNRHYLRRKIGGWSAALPISTPGRSPNTSAAQRSATISDLRGLSRCGDDRPRMIQPMPMP
jgi:pimeloyl-ACP methyl ester carboxylesterase